MRAAVSGTIAGDASLFSGECPARRRAEGWAVDADEADFGVVMGRALEGDPEAADTLYTRYSAYVRSAVRRQLHPRLRSQYDSLDFVQDVWKSFLATPAGRLRFESPQALVQFLSRVARNKVTDVFRQRFALEGRDISREQSLHDIPAVLGRDPSPSQFAAAGEEWEQLVRRFPAAYRVILERIRARYTSDEIARQAGVSLSTVNRIVRRLKDLSGY
jgi:RNA polymerase sigma-70 factor (ECF subfamily)